MGIILWIVINALVGAVIGEKKNAVTSSVIVCLLLGPIGWIIAALAADHHKYPACPFCAERIQAAALVCPHCQRDLPPAAPSSASAKSPSPSVLQRVPFDPNIPNPEDVRRARELLQRYEDEKARPAPDRPYRI